MIHFDLEDGVFIPNITFGPATVKDLRPYSDLPFDVHLELAHPEAYLEQIAQAGADIVSVHSEACPYPHRTIQYIRHLGLRAGLAFNAVTPLDAASLVLDDLDVIHLMTADPDRVGQGFLRATLSKIREAAELVGDRSIDIEVDGGINPDNVREVVEAGATVLVVGRGFFSADDPAAAMQRLRKASDPNP
jgi:ribulose-phosphate 3-epimerase